MKFIEHFTVKGRPHLNQVPMPRDMACVYYTSDPPHCQVFFLDNARRPPGAPEAYISILIETSSHNLRLSTIINYHRRSAQAGGVTTTPPPVFIVHCSIVTQIVPGYRSSMESLAASSFVSGILPEMKAENFIRVSKGSSSTFSPFLSMKSRMRVFSFLVNPSNNVHSFS